MIPKVWIQIDPNVNATGLIKSGEKLDVGLGIGSGVATNNLLKNKVKYPIYNPLKIHDIHHYNTLIYASSFISQLVETYISSKTYMIEILDQALCLLNSVLIIDGHKTINRFVFLEALNNFYLDYTILSPGTEIHQPINYILSILRIDGIYSEEYGSISYIK